MYSAYKEKNVLTVPLKYFVRKVSCIKKLNLKFIFVYFSVSLCLILLNNCAHPISEGLRKQVDPALTFSQVLQALGLLGIFFIVILRVLQAVSLSE